MRMDWCSLVDPTDIDLGCKARPSNYFKSVFYHSEPTFNPFAHTANYNYQNLSTVERLGKVSRFSDSQIASIDLCYLTLAG
jgi:hypothetical protein